MDNQSHRWWATLLLPDPPPAGRDSSSRVDRIGAALDPRRCACAPHWPPGLWGSKHMHSTTPPGSDDPRVRRCMDPPRGHTPSYAVPPAPYAGTPNHLLSLLSLRSSVPKACFNSRFGDRRRHSIVGADPRRDCKKLLELIAISTGIRSYPLTGAIGSSIGLETTIATTTIVVS
jgi:hypothetical protein